jgi:hypothetical protein
MGRVRAFTSQDIDQVVALHRRLFRPVNGGDLDQGGYRAYFRDMFLDGGWQSDACPSLVYESPEGGVVGFLGVVGREMSFHDRPIHAVVSSQFMVAPEWRASLAAFQLGKAFLTSGQDLSIADEATEAARRIWEFVGGTTALLYSLYWVRVLRPAGFLASRLNGGPRRTPLSRVLAPACRAADAVATRLPRTPFRHAVPMLSAGELDAPTLQQCIADASRDCALRPEYDRRSMAALLDVAARKPGRGTLHKVVLKKDGGAIAGWYLYHACPGGPGEVLQLGGRPHEIANVVGHLFHHAWTHGVTALAGRLNMTSLADFAGQGCFFRYRGHWTLVHSPHAGIVDAFRHGDAYLTRLEGEWTTRYRADAA